jgi:putative protease
MNAGTMVRPELVCPAGTPAALHTAVEAGADAVYCGYRNATNARNFPGLNFTQEEMEDSVRFAHERGAKVLLAANTFPLAGNTALWKQAVADGVRAGVDAIIVADIGVADYAARTWPDQRLHLSVQAGASSPEAIRYYCNEFSIRRVVLPRLLTVADIKAVHEQIPCEIEAFIFGNIGMMAEGRCSLTNYITGVSTNMDGVCSPAGAVHFEPGTGRDMIARLGEFVIDCYHHDESAGYPTICKGRYRCAARGHESYYAFEEPTSLNLTQLLPDLMRAGVTALKIEGRQRSRAYVQSVVTAFRRTIDAFLAGQDPPLTDLLALTEGHRETHGAFGGRRWR